MYRKLNLSTIIGIPFTIIAGTLLHFAYEASNYSLFIAIFAPVNESVWEHLKLLFYPALLFISITFVLFKTSYPSYFYSHILSLFTGLLSIPVLYYTYTTILGKHYLVIDIIIFIFSIFITFLLGNCITRRWPAPNSEQKAFIILFLLLLVLFFIHFTFSPPQLELFQEEH